MGTLLSFSILASAALPQAPPNESSWCLTPGSFVRELAPASDVHIQFVSRAAISEAEQLLSSRSFVRLNRTDFRRMLKAGSEAAHDRYLYLARGGIMAPVELSDTELPDYVERVSFFPSEGLAPGTLLIASLMTSEGPQRPRNMPLLISSPHAVSDIAMFCIGGR